MLDLFPSRDAAQFGHRVKHVRGARLPVTLVTGFLGAGKTTLVSRFLKTPEGHRTAIIVNEFGAVGIDDVLLRSSADETVLLGNGCVCCTTRTDLQLALRRLVADRERGAVPPFGRVIIETSGLADPSPILQTFSTDLALGREFALEVVATVVDAVTGEDTLRWSSEARKQAILADRIVVSKSDLSDAASLKRLRGRLGELNPRATILQAVNGELDPISLTGTDPASDTGTARSGLVAEAAHSDGIGSFVFREEEPLAWTEFAGMMDALLALRGDDILRVKGILNVDGCAGPVVVQYVQHLAHAPVELRAWPDDDRTSRLVFITRNVAEGGVRSLFKAMRALAFRPADA